MRRSILAAGVSALALAATLVTVPAHAHPDRDSEPDVVVNGLAGPLTLAVGDKGDVYVTQTFANTLSKVDKRGRVSTLHQLPLSPEEGELVGVARDRGATYHVETDLTGEVPTSHVVKTSRTGKRTVVSDDLWEYEIERDPDARQTYGFRNLRSSCADELADFEETVGAPIFSEYTGIVESHAYQLDVHDGTIYVADAAANAILKVNERTGRISTVGVVPSSTITFTEDLEAYVEGQFGGADLPDCLVGKRFTPEPVPTDVVRGWDGGLYVSTLEGSAGEAAPLSKVYRLSQWTGRSLELARGMHGATGLALMPTGHIVVAEMFGGEVSVIRPFTGRAATLFEAESPADVGVDGRTVYATTGTFGDGALVSYRYRGW
ncbi:hypothetical protein SAMN05216184_11814 [Georgenia satyanarayanai]|uniref:ScyD/ScyE family protein n=1 Tax=Georgenia satyanarayanai TaxID=860221 RepID=A0A2Y9APZ8_9MICO|nr:ScyD/ScyE family protein [Georgenia satyanarayanai]PYF96723.1 hypothetical protein A8987_11814 [Georgenia satyanarayanai]SSA46464.1 hypothetical protein SAMN05216184_11814 [Georgenia satyanarayanai]